MRPFYKRTSSISGIILLCFSFVASNILIVFFNSLGPEYIMIVAAVIVCGAVGFGLIMYDIMKNKYSIFGRV